MANYSLIENVNQTIADFDDIQSAINEKSGEGTVLDTDPTSTYANKIRAIASGGNYHTINWATDVTNDNNTDILSLEKYNELLEHLNEPWIIIAENKSYQITSTSNDVYNSIIIISMQDLSAPYNNIEGGYYQQNIDIEINSSRIISLIGYVLPNHVVIDTMIQNSLPPVGIISPKMDGVAAVGTSNKYSREDHVHPTDSKITTLESYFNGGSIIPEININTDFLVGSIQAMQLPALMGTYDPDQNSSVHSQIYNSGYSFYENTDTGIMSLVNSDGILIGAQTSFPLTITLNGGTTEGTDKFTFNGSSAKTLNINTGLGETWSNDGASITLKNSQVILSGNEVIASSMYAGFGDTAVSSLDCTGDAYITGDLSVSGQVNAVNGFYETSDERLKDFYKDVEIDFDKLLQLPTKYFTWKKDQKDGQDAPLMIGTSAQEVQKIYPELVCASENGELSVDYAKLSVICLAAIKELKKELNEIHSN